MTRTAADYTWFENDFPDIAEAYCFTTVGPWPLLIAVLAVADARRRELFCSDGCGHWWHRLSAPDEPAPRA
ncbi:DUF5958 family protein [Streptomyces sp. NPDC048590]|uniref:DUF5958 family protein n=1 Tax=Streptomyces sp. NPDC048590 TaxID=3365574 RepID=UPI00372192E2